MFTLYINAKQCKHPLIIVFVLEDIFVFVDKYHALDPQTNKGDFIVREDHNNILSSIILTATGPNLRIDA